MTGNASMLNSSQPPGTANLTQISDEVHKNEKQDEIINEQEVLSPLREVQASEHQSHRSTELVVSQRSQKLQEEKTNYSISWFEQYWSRKRQDYFDDINDNDPERLR